MTSDQTQNLVLVLGGVELDRRTTWYRVRLPILPNNSTGWVQRSALGDLYTVRTHLYVNLKTLTATLKRNGKTMFKTHVGLGRSAYPDPARPVLHPRQAHELRRPRLRPGRLRDERPLAGADRLARRRLRRRPRHQRPRHPPGYVSHGCIRMPNEAILTLAKMMPVGTPLTIS